MCVIAGSGYLRSEWGFFFIFHADHQLEVEDSEVLKNGRRSLDLWIKHIEERLQLTKNTHTGLFCDQEVNFNYVKPLVLWSLFAIAASVTITKVEDVGVEAKQITGSSVGTL